MFSMSRAEKERIEKLLGGCTEIRTVSSNGDVREGLQASVASRDRYLSLLSPQAMLLARHAGLGVSQVRSLLLVVALGCCASVLIGAIATAFAFLLIPALIFSVLIYLRLKAFKRTEAFERDYTAFLVSLSSSVRTGLDPLVALQQSDKLFDTESELTKELAHFNRSIERGVQEDSAVREFGAGVHHPDVRLFHTAFILARRQGSSLAHCLHRLARVTRTRQSFRRKIRGAVAMQRLSSFGIAGCAVVIVATQVVTNPDGVAMATEHAVGSKLLLAALALVIFGLGWMMKMTRSKI